MSSEIEIETIPGLPHDLPPGERVLWQGRPEWRALARQTFNVRILAAYFAIFGVARFAVAVRERQGITGARELFIVVGLALACLVVLSGMAWLHARATIYTITTHRIVLRIGVALPMTWNLPFKRIAAAQLAARKDGEGDIVLELKSPDRIAWLQLWPHTQPWHYLKARPTLRAIAEPARVAALLADAVRDWASMTAAPVAVSERAAMAAMPALQDRAMHEPMVARLGSESARVP